MSGNTTARRDLTHVCWLDGSRSQSVIQTTIETEVWVPRAGLPYLERVRSRTVDEVHAMILAVVGEASSYPGLTRIESVDEGFSVMPYLPSRQDWPAGRTIVYPATGSSEGDYIHVGVVGRDGAYQTLLIGKTFAGRDAAWAFARRLADLLVVRPGGVNKAAAGEAAAYYRPMGSHLEPSSACPPHDPFCQCFARRLQIGPEKRYREGLARRFSYVLPEPHLLDVVRRYSPLVELGAGTGYWTYLLRVMGADVVAYDSAPVGGPRKNRYHPDVSPWTDVLVGDLPVLSRHSDRSLFVCWPPTYSALWEALRFYAGECVIYVGDHGGRAARLAGLQDVFRRAEVYRAVAMDPDPSRPAELGVWRRRGRGPTTTN